VRLPGFSDLILGTDGDTFQLTRPTGETMDPDAAELRTTILLGAPTARGVRLLLDNGARFAAYLQQRYRNRDILVTPENARVRIERIDDGDGGVTWAAFPVDEAGQRVDWALLRPTGLPGWWPTTFHTVDGIQRPRAGDMMVPLPIGGVAVATMERFHELGRNLAALAGAPGELFPAVVRMVNGAFVVGDYNGEIEQIDGAEFGRRLLARGADGNEIMLGADRPADLIEAARLMAQARAGPRRRG